MGTLASVVVRVGADINNFVSDMGRAATLSKRQGQQIARGLAVVGTAAAGAFATGVTKAAEFEKAMGEVITLLDDTSAVDDMKKAMADLSVQYGTTQVEQVKALYNAISSGAEAGKEAIDLMTAANELAVAGVSDVYAAVNVLTNLMNVYGESAGTAEDITDDLFTTVKKGRTTMPELADSIGRVATLAQAGGIGLGQILSALATLTLKMPNTKESITSLKDALKTMIKPTPAVIKAADKMGINFKEAKDQSMGLANWMRMVGEKTGGTAEEMAKLFPNVEGLNAALVLANPNSQTMVNILAEMQTNTGAVATAVDTMEQTASHKFEQLKSKVNAVYIELGNNLLPTVNTLLEKWLNWTTGENPFFDDLDTASRATRQLNNILRNGKGTTEEYQEAIKNARKALKLIETQTGYTTQKLIVAKKRFGENSSVVFSLNDELDELWRVQKSLNLAIGAGEDKLKDLNTIQEVRVTAVKKEVGATMTLAEWQNKLRVKYNGVIAKHFPLITASRKYKAELKALNDLLAAGVINEEQHAEAVKSAGDEYEDAKNKAKGLDGALQEVVVTAKKVDVKSRVAAHQMKKQFTNVATIIENSFKRLDDTFANFWQTLLKDGKFSLKGIKDLFLDTIAQMLHAAITQPIVLRIGAIMTGGLAGTAQAAGGSIFGQGGFMGSIASMGKGLVNSVGSMWGAQGGWAGVGENVAGGIGGYLGYKLGGNTNTGGQVGAALGGAALGYFGGVVGGIIGGPLGAVVGKALGAFVGGLLGNLVGGLFGSDPKIKAGGINAFRGLRDTQFFDSALGGVYVGKTRGGMDEHVEEFGNAIAELDNTLAQFMSDDQISRATAALENWQTKMVGDAISVEDMVASRFDTVLGTFSDSVQAYVNNFDGIEERVQALGRYITALNTLGATIANFAANNPADVLAAQLEEAGKTSTERLRGITDSLVDLMDNFDGTPEMMDQISQLVDARYRGELEYLNAINDLIKSITQSIADQQEMIRSAMMQGEEPTGAQTFVDQWKAIRELFASIEAAASPEELAAIVNQIQAMVGTAFGGLDPAGQARQGQMLIDFLSRVQDAATQRAEELAQMQIDEGMVLRESLSEWAESIGAPLEANVEATNAVNDSINRQTDVIGRGNDENREALAEILSAIREGNELVTLRGLEVGG